MPIMYTHVGALNCPIVYCDYCSRRIEKAGQGNVYWYDERPDELLFNHKRCAWSHDRALERANPSGLLLSEELTDFLRFVCANLGAA